MNKESFRLTVSASPVLVQATIVVIVFTIDVVFIDESVSVVVGGIVRSSVDIVVCNTGPLVFSRCACPGNKWNCGAQWPAPFKLEVTVEVNAITVLINFLVEVWQWLWTIVSQILSPSTGRAGLPCIFTAEFFSVVSVSVNVEHGYEVDLTGIDEIRELLF